MEYVQIFTAAITTQTVGAGQIYTGVQVDEPVEYVQIKKVPAPTAASTTQTDGAGQISTGVQVDDQQTRVLRDLYLTMVATFEANMTTSESTLGDADQELQETIDEADRIK
jgi:hypothetical protein